MGAGEIATILTALAGVILAYTAYRKAVSESFTVTGKEWRELVEQLRLQASEIEQEANGLSNKIEQLEKSLDEKQLEINALSGRISGLVAENSKLKRRVFSLQQENGHLKNRVSTLESLNAELIFSIERLENEKKALAEKIAGQFSDVATQMDNKMEVANQSDGQ